MSIVSSVIVRDHNRGNGTRSIHEQHVDHNGVIHGHRYTCPLAHDESVALQERADNLPLQLEDGELQDIASFIESGGDPLQVDLKHVTNKQALRQIVKTAMEMNMSDVVPVAEFINTLTDAHLRSVFSPTVTQKIRSRVDRIISMKSDIDADTALKGEV